MNHIGTILHNPPLNFLHIIWIVADDLCKGASLSDGIQLFQSKPCRRVVSLVPEAVSKPIPLESSGYDASEGLSQNRPGLGIFANAARIQVDVTDKLIKDVDVFA